MTEFFNRTTEKTMRQQLRQAMPKAEVLLWSRLRGKQLCGYKFRRQYSVGPYSIDFYCPAAKLAIELDGDSHFYPAAQHHDEQRQRYVESFGIRCLRFTNSEVYENLDGVLETVARALQDVAAGGGKDTPLNPPFVRGEARHEPPDGACQSTSSSTKRSLKFLPLTKGESEGVL
jgi:very-short-patch-repair endonuclease